MSSYPDTLVGDVTPEQAGVPEILIDPLILGLVRHLKHVHAEVLADLLRAIPAVLVVARVQEEGDTLISVFLQVKHARVVRLLLADKPILPHLLSGFPVAAAPLQNSSSGCTIEAPRNTHH